MKKIVLFVLLLFTLFFSAMPASTQEKTNDELLAETVALAKEVKEFGRALGIAPSKALTGSSKETPATSLANFYVQEKMKISAPGSFYMAFSASCENLPLKNKFRTNTVSKQNLPKLWGGFV